MTIFKINLIYRHGSLFGRGLACVGFFDLRNKRIWISVERCLAEINRDGNILKEFKLFSVTNPKKDRLALLAHLAINSK